MTNETYYDILKVQKDCTNDEIRKAFVELSKKFHPDAAGSEADPKNTAQFVKISEAYKVLSKQRLRADYDQDLLARGFMEATGRPMQTGQVHKPWEIKPDYDPNPGAYYGIKGMNRVSNSKIGFIFATVAIFGGIVGFFSVFRSHDERDRSTAEKSEKANSHHAAVRADAMKYGNEEQIQRVVDRMFKAQNR